MKEEKKRKGLWNESLVILKQRTCFPDTQDFFSAVWIDDLSFFIRLIRILRTYSSNKIYQTKFWHFFLQFFSISIWTIAFLFSYRCKYWRIITCILLSFSRCDLKFNFRVGSILHLSTNLFDWLRNRRFF